MNNFLNALMAASQAAEVQFLGLLEHQLLLGLIMGFVLASFFYAIFMLNFPKDFLSVMFSKDAAECYHNVCTPKTIGAYNRISFEQFSKHLEHIQLAFFVSFFIFILFITIIYNTI